MNQKLAQMILDRTHGYGQIDLLTGPHNAEFRAIVLTLLTGFKVPKSKAGIHALFATLKQEAKITPACIAHEEDQVASWIKEQAKAGAQ